MLAYSMAGVAVTTGGTGWPINPLILRTFLENSKMVLKVKSDLSLNVLMSVPSRNHHVKGLWRILQYITNH